MNIEIDRQLRDLLQAEKASHSPELPSAALVWWKAQLLERRQLQERSLLPIRALRTLVAAIICVAAVLLLYAGVRMGALDHTILASGSVMLATIFVFMFWLARPFLARTPTKRDHGVH